jgi:hypothetical protein
MMEGGVITFSISGLQTRLNNSNHDGDDKKELSKRIHFLLCESCFWCASYISSKSVSVAKCPNCYNNKIEWMPISKVDIDKFSPKGAIEFHNTTATQHSQLGDRR